MFMRALGRLRTASGSGGVSFRRTRAATVRPPSSFPQSLQASGAAPHIQPPPSTRYRDDSQLLHNHDAAASYPTTCAVHASGMPLSVGSNPFWGVFWHGMDVCAYLVSHGPRIAENAPRAHGVAPCGLLLLSVRLRSYDCGMHTIRLWGAVVRMSGAYAWHTDVCARPSRGHVRTA